jgi:hypothetical protein
VCAGMQIIGLVGKFKDAFDVPSVPTLTHRQWACRSRDGYRHWPPANQ